MFGLGGLLHASYENLDRGLLCAFVERWHAETNNFHLPIGEMTITLDYVSNLLHLLIVDHFYTQETLNADSVKDLLVKSLCVDRGVASEETRHCRRAHVRLSWLRDVYEDACSRRQWTLATRAYLLHLVGCTIFADKSATLVSVFYLGFFVDLRLTRECSWATTALTHMYEQLGDCSYASTKQLAGYATLLQGRIYEHFSSIGMRRMQALYSEDQPQCRMYDARKVTSNFLVRLQLDTLITTSIRFCSYNEHREERPFEWISLFSSYLRLGNWTQLNMSERILRQYGYT